MNGPSHYQHAETLLDLASEDETGSDEEHFHLCKAEVHATLALAAAIGMGMAATDPADADVAAWYKAAGTPAQRKNGGTT